VGATQNRLGSFVDGLLGRGHEVTVVCEQPNHPAGVFSPGYGRRALITSHEHGATVHRVWVAAFPVKTTARRLAFYATYGIGAAAVAASRRGIDVAFSSSPPLPGALTVAAAMRTRRIPHVLDVRDLWPAAAQALGELSNARILATFERAERWVYRSSAAVTATTRPFCEHIESRGARRVVHLPNGALDELLYVPTPPRDPAAAYTVGYAGNFGIAQGLGVVLDAAERLSGHNVRFLMIGEGPVKAGFIDECERRGLTEHVEVRPAVPVDAIGPLLASCDALLVPLRDHRLLKDFIPSKLYDAMALGRPALVAAAGEPHALVAEVGCGLPVRPEDGEDLARAVRRLINDPEEAAAMGAAGRAAAPRFVRSKQVERLEAVLMEAAGG
jgi:glycosyltransferase involved in cell wall biosynthesis